MPVQRFRRFEDARRASWLEATDPRLPERMAWVFAWARGMDRATGARGVQRFRTFEDAARERSARVQRRVTALLEERAEASKPSTV